MMKRASILLILALALLLQSCGGNPKYYDTCSEAFIEKYSEAPGVTPQIESEICTVRFSDELTVYAFISSDNKLVTCAMKEKEGKFRLVDCVWMQTPTNSLPDQIAKDGFQVAHPDNKTMLFFQWIATDSLPAERDESYQYKDFSFLDQMHEEVRITLVYYEAKVNY